MKTTTTWDILDGRLTERFAWLSQSFKKFGAKSWSCFRVLIPCQFVLRSDLSWVEGFMLPGPLSVNDLQTSVCWEEVVISQL